MTFDEVTHKIQEANIEVLHVENRNAVHNNFCFKLDSDLYLFAVQTSEGLSFSAHVISIDNSYNVVAADLVWSNPKSTDFGEKSDGMTNVIRVYKGEVHHKKRKLFNETELHELLKHIKKMIA